MISGFVGYTMYFVAQNIRWLKQLVIRVTSEDKIFRTTQECPKSKHLVFPINSRILRKKDTIIKNFLHA